MRVPSFDLDLKLAEMKINGYVIFEELFPVETIDRIRAAFMPVMEQVREKTRGSIRICRGRSDRCSSTDAAMSAWSSRARSST